MIAPSGLGWKQFAPFIIIHLDLDSKFSKTSDFPWLFGSAGKLQRGQQLLRVQKPRQFPLGISLG